MSVDARALKVHHAAEGEWFEVTLHRVRDDGLGQLYQETGSPGARIIHIVRLPYAVFDEMGKPTRLTLTVRAGDVHASTLKLWDGP